MSWTFSRLKSFVGLLIFCTLLLLGEGCFSTAPKPLFYQETALPADQIATQISNLVRKDLDKHPQSRESQLLYRFYTANEGRPGWINKRGISLAAWQLIAVLQNAAQEGLPPQRYGPERLQKMLRPAVDENEAYLGWSLQQVAQTDIALSRAFFRYAGDNLRGQERSWRSRGDWHRTPRKVDATRLLDLALDLDALPSALRELPPPQKGYQRLRHRLKYYRALAALGGWAVIAEGATLHPGESDLRVPQLRHRLQIEGDLGSEVSQGEFFGREIAQGLKLFQQRHGLMADGTLGPRTLQALNTSIESRIDQILRNLERWRWSSGQSFSTEIRINLASFSLEVTKESQQELTMPVIIGRQKRPTPLFSSQLEAMILSPYWYVPPTLLRETLPHIVADPSYLRRNHYEVLDSAGDLVRMGQDFGRMWQRGEISASLRQRPGPWNPMGQIKFILPNPWSIYLHDTPTKNLFNREQRAFSSGCIRLSNPQQLASWLLERSDWESPRIDSLLKSRSSRMISLEEPVALSIGYWTAWVDEGGRLNFRDDIYGRDQRLAKELRQTPPQLVLLP